MQSTLVNLAYLVASTLFILTFKGLAHPRTAVRANRMGATGMLVAVVATLVNQDILSYQWIAAGMAAGATIGALIALKIAIISMPQMVALLNGLGGGASVLVASAVLMGALAHGSVPGIQFRIATAFSGLIGGIAFWGSLVAWGKLQGVLSGKPLLFKGQHALNLMLALGALGSIVWLVVSGGDTAMPFWALIAFASLLGLTSVFPIGGADMPVVICLLNSYSGLAACATGFVLNNNMLIIAGALVGASGIILTQIMCKAMNRPLSNVLFGGMGAEVAGKTETDEIYAGKVKSAAAEEVAMLLETARRVVIVPGYGLAVSQAQHAVRDLARTLEARGVEVEFGIHPVAGRMPGHMNVLLAEADVPYEKVKEMDVINSTFDQTDVAIVIGANDVVNPLARTDPTSPIAGMPILDVDKARTVVVIKRSLSPGFAGIPNPLFAADNTLMLFGDGKKAILDLLSAIKEAA